tara:strand:- start:10526 stop:10834 length:309 start_codon:yes stop_codon:yes gene_type:complete
MPDKCPVCGAPMLEEYDDEVFGHMILFDCSATDDGYEYASNVKTGIHNPCPNAHRIALRYRRMWERLKEDYGPAYLVHSEDRPNLEQRMTQIEQEINNEKST